MVSCFRWDGGGLFFDLGPMNADTHKGTSRRDAGVVLRASQAPIGMEALRSGLGQGDRSPMVPIVALKYDRAKSLIDCIRNDFDLTCITANQRRLHTQARQARAWRTNC